MDSIASSAILPLTSEKVTNRRKAAQELESVFLAEMLKTSGLGKTPNAFGGGSGEDQFSSFLISEYADKISRSGGIGIAQHIFSAISGLEEPRNG